MKHSLTTRGGGPYDLFDMFDDFFKPTFFDGTREMRTNITETDNAYLLELALPGYGKDEIKVSLENGYLTVSAVRQKREENSNYLRREIAESSSRSFYVGTEVEQEDIRAKYENGILNLTVPKTQPRRYKANKYIDIE